VKASVFGNNQRMTSVDSMHRITKPNVVAVGTIVWLSSELMFFAALFAMYFTTRGVQGPAIWGESTALLSIPFAAVNTTILVLSSVTCQFGVFAAERFQSKRQGSLLQINLWGMREWFALTFHGLHVTGGLIAFLIVLVRVAKARRFTHQQATTAIVVSYYWHFVDVVWIALFAAIYLIK
jgi:cytochrome c oxidase subunit 3